MDLEGPATLPIGQSPWWFWEVFCPICPVLEKKHSTEQGAQWYPADVRGGNPRCFTGLSEVSQLLLIIDIVSHVKKGPFSQVDLAIFTTWNCWNLLVTPLSLTSWDVTLGTDTTARDLGTSRGATTMEWLPWHLDGGFHWTSAMPEMDGKNALREEKSKTPDFAVRRLGDAGNLEFSPMSSHHGSSIWCIPGSADDEAKGRDFLYYRSQHHQKEEALKFGSNGAKWGLQSSSRFADSFSSLENSQHRLVHASTLWCLW